MQEPNFRNDRKSMSGQKFQCLVKKDRSELYDLACNLWYLSWGLIMAAIWIPAALFLKHQGVDTLFSAIVPMAYLIATGIWTKVYSIKIGCGFNKVPGEFMMRRLIKRYIYPRFRRLWQMTGFPDLSSTEFYKMPWLNRWQNHPDFVSWINQHLAGFAYWSLFPPHGGYQSQKSNQTDFSEAYYLAKSFKVPVVNGNNILYIYAFFHLAKQELNEDPFAIHNTSRFIGLGELDGYINRTMGALHVKFIDACHELLAGRHGTLLVAATMAIPAEIHLPKFSEKALELIRQINAAMEEHEQALKWLKSAGLINRPKSHYWASRSLKDLFEEDKTRQVIYGRYNNRDQEKQVNARRYWVDPEKIDIYHIPGLDEAVYTKNGQALAEILESFMTIPKSISQVVFSSSTPLPCPE